jgi:hypothetical protein
MAGWNVGKLLFLILALCSASGQQFFSLVEPTGYELSANNNPVHDNCIEYWRNSTIESVG